MVLTQDQKTRLFAQLEQEDRLSGWIAYPTQEEVAFIASQSKKSDFYAKMYRSILQYGSLSKNMLIYAMWALKHPPKQEKSPENIQVGDKVEFTGKVIRVKEMTFQSYTGYSEVNKTSYTVQDPEGFSWVFFGTKGTGDLAEGDIVSISAKVKKFAGYGTVVNYAKRV
jgi:hypothetical protein